LAEALDAMTSDPGDIIYISDDDEAMELDHFMDFPDNQDLIDVREETDIKTDCKDAVLRIFPDICPEYLENLAIQHAYQHETLITAILDQTESGKAVFKRASLKRKREVAEAADHFSDLKEKYDSPQWRARKKDPGYTAVA
jgi:TRIAD3 protein (E3 ubiquitin-protein ligase RNF216)